MICLLLTCRFNDGNQFGRVMSAGQSFIVPVSKNGLPIPWERGYYGDVQVVNHRVRLYQMNIDVGVRKLRIRMWIDWLPHIVVLNPV